MDSENGEKIDRTLSCLDAINTKLDAFSKRMDAQDAAMDAWRKKKDGAEAAQIDGMISTHRGGEEMGEEEGDPKESSADSRSDSLYDQPQGRKITDAQRDELSEIQADAARLFSAHGWEEPRPMQNELPFEYRRRTANRLKSHSQVWKDVDLKPLPPDAIKVAQAQIYKDSFEAATANETYEGLGQLHEIRKVNRDTGHVIREYRGHPMQWMQQFAAPRRLAKFNLNKIRNHD
jgi:hypothetical protein